MTRSSEELEAIQAVVDRVGSYQDGATEGTTEKELRSAFGETDIDPTEDEISKLVDAIEADPASADAATVLG
ncbi:hypothetical protein [Nocardioides sp. AX2bis]|uniref:hypothetical protein n=1 Tax=Nocardioides sp. AX2bis TaxID=2653157 RepID=UPI0012F2CA82|nr:hypothetical protein [Nocardioides sp. AX2bis]VXB18356.1 conserved hypothetical protein [Nocardioides sp. AX2bis]